MALQQTIIEELWRPLYGELQQGFQLLTPEWDRMQRMKNWTQLSEREVIWPTNLRFGGGVTATVDGGTPARAMSNEPVEATQTWAWFARRFSVSLGMMKAENDGSMSKQQIKKQVAYQADDALQAFRKRIAIAFWGFDDNVLCEINSAGGAPTYTLKDLYGRTGLAVDTDLFSPNNEFVAIIDPGGPTERGRAKVTGVNPATPSITLASSIGGATASDLVVFANALDQTADVNDLDLGFPGFLQHLHATSLHGITEAAEPEWVPGHREDKSGVALDEAELFLAFTKSNRRSPYKCDFALSTPEVIATAGGAQLDKVRYTSDPGTIVLGFDKLKTMGVEVMIAEFCPKGYFIADSTKSVKKFSPDEEPFKVKEGGEPFMYYGTALGYFCDIVFRAGLTRMSRRSLVGYYGVKDS